MSVQEYLYGDENKEELVESYKSLQDDLDKLDREGCYSGDQYYQDICCDQSYICDLLEEKYGVKDIELLL